jgi:hypothetical protein
MNKQIKHHSQCDVLFISLLKKTIVVEAIKIKDDAFRFEI